MVGSLFAVEVREEPLIHGVHEQLEGSFGDHLHGPSLGPALVPSALGEGVGEAAGGELDELSVPASPAPGLEDLRRMDVSREQKHVRNRSLEDESEQPLSRGGEPAPALLDQLPLGEHLDAGSEEKKVRAFVGELGLQPAPLLLPQEVAVEARVGVLVEPGVEEHHLAGEVAGGEYGGGVHALLPPPGVIGGHTEEVEEESLALVPPGVPLVAVVDPEVVVVPGLK